MYFFLKYFSKKYHIFFVVDFLKSLFKTLRLKKSFLPPPSWNLKWFLNGEKIYTFLLFLWDRVYGPPSLRPPSLIGKLPIKEGGRKPYPMIFHKFSWRSYQIGHIKMTVWESGDSLILELHERSYRKTVHV